MGFMRMSGLEMTKLAALAVLMLAAGPAAAQIAQSSDAPVDITADSLDNTCHAYSAPYAGVATHIVDVASQIRVVTQPSMSRSP